MRRFFLLVFFIAGLTGASAAQALPSVDQIARIGRGYVQAVAWSPDGAHFAVGTSIGVWLYDTSDWDAEPALAGTNYPVTSLAFSPAGGMIAAGKADGTAHVFATNGLQDIHYLIAGPVPERGAMANFNIPVRAVTFVPASEPDGKTPDGAVSVVVLNDTDSTALRLKATLNLPEGEPQPSDAANPDGTQNASFVRDSVRISDASNGETLHTLSGFTLPLVDVAFSADGTTLIARELDNTLQVYDASTGQRLGTYAGAASDGGAFDVTAFDADSQRVAYTVRSRTIVVVDSVLGPVTVGGRDDSVTSLAFAPGGGRIAAGFHDGTLSVYDDIGPVDAAPRNAYAHFGSVMDILWLRDPDMLITAGEETYLKIWDAKRAILGGAETFGTHAGEVTALAASPTEAALFASASVDGTIKLWRLQR